jgi:hypothetical protein
MARKLKVFRTAIGFHDAYVAAPSQKAALAAWGSDRNLFGTGMAEVVSDPKLTEAPLAAPGTVIKVKRGTDREHLAALPKTAPKAAPRTADKEAERDAEKPAERPAPPRPKRTALDRAEKAVAAAEKARDREIEGIDAQIKALQAKRRTAAERHRAKLDKLDDERSIEAERYAAAIEAWREG